jgi:hypothetical protein
MVLEEHLAAAGPRFPVVLIKGKTSSFGIVVK